MRLKKRMVKYLRVNSAASTLSLLWPLKYSINITSLSIFHLDEKSIGEIFKPENKTICYFYFLVVFGCDQELHTC